MIEIIGEPRDATEDELKELENGSDSYVLPEWGSRMLKVFLGGHYEDDQ